MAASSLELSGNPDYVVGFSKMDFKAGSRCT